MFWTGDDDRKVSNFANHFPTSKLFSKVSRCNFTLFKTFRFLKKTKSRLKTSFSLLEKVGCSISLRLVTNLVNQGQGNKLPSPHPIFSVPGSTHTRHE